jgi:hypothetical protein
MDDRMERRAPWVPWAVTSVVLLVVAVVAYVAGMNTAGGEAGEAAGHRAWVFFPFGGIWLFFLMFWIFGGLRWMFWGAWCRPWRYRRYAYPPWHDDDRQDWEEWHRRAHERMGASAGSGPARPESTQRPV